MVKVTAWLNQNSLRLNVAKTICRLCSFLKDMIKKKKINKKQDIFISVERVQVVSECK